MAVHRQTAGTLDRSQRAHRGAAVPIGSSAASCSWLAQQADAPPV